MTWNYRIVRYRDDKGYGLHEVYYNKAELPKSMTKDPASFACDSDEGPDSIIKSLVAALKDATSREVLDEPLKWASDEADEELIQITAK